MTRRSTNSWRRCTRSIPISGACSRSRTSCRAGSRSTLQRWVEGGQYARLFDHVEDTVTLAPFQYVDFEGLDGVPMVLEPLLFYLLHRATATILDPALAGTLKVFVLDEAWRFLRDADDSRLRHRGAQDVAQEERVRADGHAVE